MTLDEELRGKIATNGPYVDMTTFSQAMKVLLRQGKNWEKLPPESKETLELIATRVAMILNGDFADPKHWNRIAMYGRLREQTLAPPPPLARNNDIGSQIADMAIRRARPAPPAFGDDE